VGATGTFRGAASDRLALVADAERDRRMRRRTKEMWWGIALQAPDSHGLASFYAQLPNWPLAYNEPNHTIV
jgi:hypothetical protein